MLVELHCHSHYSQRIKVRTEGMNSPAEIMGHARATGIGAVAVTDHDVFKARKEASLAAKRYGVIHIPGEEVSTDKGHMLALGINEWIRPHQSVEETIDEIHSQGGIAVASHPFDINNDGIKEGARLCDAMETFNCLNLDRIANIRGVNFAWLHKIPGVAGSDAHMLQMMGHGLNEVDAWDADSILREIRKGRATIASRKYIPLNVIRHWSILRLRSSYDSIMDYIENNYIWPKSAVSKKLLNLVRGYPGSADNLFKIITYVSLTTAVGYSVLKSLPRFD